MRRKEHGFTLMELMVVIVIVAILAAVAVPLYINYVKDAQRTEAKGAIGAVITAEQTNYQLKGTYVATTFIRNPGPTDQNGLTCDLTESLANWNISVAAGTSGIGTSYVVTAAWSGGGTSPGTVTYTYDRTLTTGGAWNP